MAVDECLMAAQAPAPGAHDAHVRTDARSKEAVEAMACWSRISKHLEMAIAELAKLEALETQPVKSLWFAIHDDPLAQHADYLAWKAKTAAAASFAARAARGYPKSSVWLRDASGEIVRNKKGRPTGAKPGPNRARGELVDQLFEDLLTFWKSRRRACR
jgi:hypothetical protein